MLRLITETNKANKANKDNEPYGSNSKTGE